jgi:hypothetical protein
MAKMNSLSWFMVWVLFAILVYFTPLRLVTALIRQPLEVSLDTLGANLFALPTILAYALAFGVIWLIAYCAIRWPSM